MSPASALFRNASTRPVELHLPEGVMVLPPGATIERDAGDPICAVLERRGVLTRHAVPPAPPRVSIAAEPTEGTSPGARRGRGRQSAPRPRKHPGNPDGEPT
jgi:hypothetical protein